MKKEYIAPNMRVKEMAARKMMCTSNSTFNINSSKTTTQQFSRDFDYDDYEEEDW